MLRNIAGSNALGPGVQGGVHSGAGARQQSCQEKLLEGRVTCQVPTMSREHGTALGTAKGEHGASRGRRVASASQEGPGTGAAPAAFQTDAI